jgi:hypothetical protein
MELDAARLLLSKMGIAPADLLAETEQRPAVPTFSEYIPQVSWAVSPATARSYGSYWRRVEEAWGGRRLDEPSPSEIKQLAEESRANALTDPLDHFDLSRAGVGEDDFEVADVVDRALLLLELVEVHRGDDGGEVRLGGHGQRGELLARA